MLVLLPPSEGKAAGGDGPAVDLATLSFPELTATRRRVGNALVRTCRGNPARARSMLGLSAALDSDRADDAVLWESPTMPAGLRYSGVLYDALGYPRLPVAARRRADVAVIVFSGLWGAVRLTDLLPAYRIGIGTRLSRLAPLPALWRQPVTRALDDLVVAQGAIDMRSTGYSVMYRPSAAAAARMVSVKIVGPDGARTAPSYQSKAAKGALARETLRAGAPDTTRLLAAAERLGFEATESTGGVVVRLPPGWPNQIGGITADVRFDGAGD